MVGTKAQYAQMAIALLLLVVTISNPNAQLHTYSYGCTERTVNFYICTDGEHPVWDRYNPYSGSRDPRHIGVVDEIFGTPSSQFECAWVEPGANSRRRVRGRVLLNHPIGLPSSPATSRHWANVECWSPPPPPPPPPPIIVLNETESMNLEFMLCTTTVRPGAPTVIVGLQPGGEEGDRCALDPGGGPGEKKQPSNNN